MQRRDEYYPALKAIDGLIPESQPWWNAIDRGEIQQNIIEGTITKTFMSGHNDYPEFSMMNDNGDELNWPRYNNGTILSRIRAKILYRPGNRIRIKFIEHAWRTDMKPIQGWDPANEPPYKFVTAVEIARA